MSISLGWEGNRRSGVESQTVVVYPPTDSTAYVTGMSTPLTLLLRYGLHYLLCSSPRTKRHTTYFTDGTVIDNTLTR